MRPQILLLDNADSFTSILAHELRACGADVTIVPATQYKNDLPGCYHAMVISPGPGLPQDNKLPQIIRQNAGKLPILGVCLGMQAIAEAFGGQLKNLEKVYHGQRKTISHNGKGLFRGLDNNLAVGLYHSWCVEQTGQDVEVTALSEDKIIMAIKHVELNILGVQFHPESYITHDGRKILANWLALIS